MREPTASKKIPGVTEASPSHGGPRPTKMPGLLADGYPGTKGIGKVKGAPPVPPKGEMCRHLVARLRVLHVEEVDIRDGRKVLAKRLDGEVDDPVIVQIKT